MEAFFLLYSYRKKGVCLVDIDNRKWCCVCVEGWLVGRERADIDENVEEFEVSFIFFCG